jgi:hypothetical protein
MRTAVLAEALEILRDVLDWKLPPELAPQQDARAERHFLVAAVESHDAELSEWIWSNGHPALPPLARYLMYAATLRYQVRVWDEGKKIGKLRGEVDGCLARLGKVLADIGSGQPGTWLASFVALR